MIKKTQNKALRIISFKDWTQPSVPFYANNKILKLKNIITLTNCLFIYDQLCDNLPKTYSNYFKLDKNQHRYNKHFTLNISRVNTETYGSNSSKIKAIENWNKATKKNQFHSDFLFKRSKYVTLGKAYF